MDNLLPENQINEIFLQNLQSNGDLQKVAGITSAYIKERVRETSFLDVIMPPENLTKDDLDLHPDSDEPMKYMFLQPHATAKSVTFRGKPDDRWIEGKKCPVLFHKIMSERISKSEAELLTYRYPIVKEVEEVCIKDMARVRDAGFVTTCQSIVDWTLAGPGRPDISAAYTGPFGRAAVNEALKKFAVNEVKPATILVNEADWYDFNAANAMEESNDIVKEMVVNGYGHSTLMGHKLLVTNKSTIVPPKTVWVFAAPEFLGKNYVLAPVRFQIKKDLDVIEMVSWGYFGAGIGNIRGLVKLTLS
jgi:hypothetical protein